MMYEWLLSDEYDVCDHMLYLFLYLDCKELCGNIATICWFMWRWLMVYICDNYMLIELWMLLVIVYMLSGGELLLIAYIQVLVMLRWIVCVNICIVVESYVHAYMTDGGGFYIQLRWLRCFCCIKGDDLEVFWYHMHLDESRDIA